MRYLDADAVAALGPVGAVDAIVHALRAGLDPASDAPRTATGLTHGQFLLMPSETATAAGVKVVTVAPDNPRHNRPRIHAAYLLFEHDTLALRAILDGTALTTLRTPAVSVAAVLDRLPDRPLHLAVFGTGPQGVGHVETFAAVRPVATTTYLARDPARSPLPAIGIGTPPAHEALARADVVVCATAARTPLFDSQVVRDDAVVIAVGSHEPDARELDAALLARSTVVVENRATALREAGDVVLAVAEDVLRAEDLVPLTEVVSGRRTIARDRPLVFKSVGMSWEDLVVATAIVTRAGG